MYSFATIAEAKGTLPETVISEQSLLIIAMNIEKYVQVIWVSPSSGLSLTIWNLFAVQSRYCTTIEPWIIPFQKKKKKESNSVWKNLAQISFCGEWDLEFGSNTTTYFHQLKNMWNLSQILTDSSKSVEFGSNFKFSHIFQLMKICRGVWSKYQIPLSAEGYLC